MENRQNYEFINTEKSNFGREVKTNRDHREFENRISLALGSESKRGWMRLVRNARITHGFKLFLDQTSEISF